MQQDTEQQPGLNTLGLADNRAGAQTAEDAIAEGHRQQALSGANWFFWIAGFSVINTIVLLAQGEWNFLIGLGVTQLIDGVAYTAAQELGAAATALALFLDAMVAGFFVVMGLMARRGFGWAFVLGMVAYALDALIFLYVQEWANIAFHAFALFFIYRGFAANGHLRRLRAEAATARA
jgi:hypothetical protein